MQARASRLAKVTLTWLIISALAGVELVVVVGFYWVERIQLHAVEKDVTYGKSSESKHLWKFEMPGLRNPPALSATASKIADGDEVVGVVVNGKPRAYSLKALKYPPWHIVNDVVVGVPVSVTYCDRTNCMRVYTDRQSSSPLDIDLGGLYGKEMVVKIGGVLYFQETGKPFEAGDGAPALPYADHPWERTTWKEWNQRHPDSDVFIGLGGMGPKP
jgi:Protein of unknown function (DUF3179)